MNLASDQARTFDGGFGRHFNWTMAVAALGVVLPFGLVPLLISLDPAWGRGGLGQFTGFVAVVVPLIAWLILAVIGFFRYRVRAFSLLLGLPLAGLYWIFAIPCMTGLAACL